MDINNLFDSETESVYEKEVDKLYSKKYREQ